MKNLRPILLFLVSSAIILVQLISCASTNVQSSVRPLWMDNKNAVYPEISYLSFMGTGKSIDDAKLSAASAVSYYFKTSIDAQMSTSQRTETNLSGTVDESFAGGQTVSIASQLETAGIQYSDIYYDKNAPRSESYKCIAFIDREKAAERFAAQVTNFLATSNAFYDKARAVENDPFTALSYWRSAYSSGNDFLMALQCLQLVDNSGRNHNAAYRRDSERISAIPAFIAEDVLLSTFYINVSGDWQQIIQTGLTQILSEKYRVVQNEKDAAYIVDVKVSENKSKEGDYFVLYPSTEISLVNTLSRNTVYKYSVSQQKSTGITEDRVHRTAYSKVVEELKKSLMQDMLSYLNVSN